MDADALPLLDPPRDAADDPLGSAIRAAPEDAIALFTRDTNLLRAPDWQAADYAGIPPDLLVNTGVFLVRSNAAGEALLQAVWDIGGGEDGEKRLAERFDIHAELKRQALHDPTLKEQLPESFFKVGGWPWEQGAFWLLLSEEGNGNGALHVMDDTTLNRIGADVPTSCFANGTLGTTTPRPTGGAGMIPPAEDAACTAHATTAHTQQCKAGACATAVLHMAGWSAEERADRAAWEVARAVKKGDRDAVRPVARELEQRFLEDGGVKVIWAGGTPACAHPRCMRSGLS